MKAFAILMMILAASVLAGCSNDIPMNAPETISEDLEMNIEEAAIDPDIGELDDFDVSDELPQ